MRPFELAACRMLWDAVVQATHNRSFPDDARLDNLWAASQLAANEAIGVTDHWQFTEEYKDLLWDISHAADTARQEFANLPPAEVLAWRKTRKR